MGQRRAEPSRESPLAGNTVVLTGTLPSMGPKEAEKLVASLGGKPSGSVSPHTPTMWWRVPTPGRSTTAIVLRA